MSGPPLVGAEPVGPLDRPAYSPPPPTEPPSAPTQGLPVAEELPPTGGPLRRLGLRSLTARILLLVAALMFVAVVAVTVATYVALRSSLIARLDSQVRSAAGQNAAFFSNCQQTGPASFSCRTPTGPRQFTKEWVTFLGSDGETAFQVKSGPLYRLDLDAGQRDELAEHPDRILSVRQDGQELRVAGRVNRVGLLVVTGVSTQEVDTTLSKLVGREFIIGAAAILVIVIGTFYGVRLTLRSLREVTETAEDVATELSPEGAGLDRRVHLTDDNTEVGQLATSFNMMLAAVETQFGARVESEQRMRQFLADASHELRTPLTSIRGYAELARMQRAVGDNTGDNLDRIEFEGTRMSRLVEDLLMLARGDADGSDRPLQREWIDVGALLDDAASGSRAAFPGRRVDVRTAGTPHVVGDPDQLLRVVRNLINNAAIHTSPERPIVVNGFADPSGVHLQVIDGGPGLPPEDAAHVFERFWRADKARTRARGGSGLGLSIVASIVRAHGGSVRFDSTVEGGSTVTVTLPGGQASAD